MRLFEIEEGKIYMTTKIKEGDVLILQNGNYEIIREINTEKGIIKSTIIDTEEERYCQCEITIENFMKEENQENYYKKMEDL